MDKILEALANLVPDEQKKELSEAVKNMIEEAVASAKAELEAEFNANLEEAYASLAEELAESEKVAENGYREAFDIISDLRNRLDVQRAEYDAALEESYEEAYQVVKEEQGKNETIESELYETYEKRFAETKEFMIDKVDQFLRTKGQEIYEQARRDILNDPSMVEHKLVLDKIVESVSDYISDEDHIVSTSSKLDQANKALKEALERNKIMEARNIRLGVENSKLNEQIKEAAELLSESTEAAAKESKKARVEKAKNVTGRGEVTTEGKVIAEHVAPTTGDSKDTTVNPENEQVKSWNVLAGTLNSNK